MVKIILYLEEDTAHVLEELTSREGRSQADVIREALLSYQGKDERPSPRGLGMYKSGRADISGKAEELLFQDSQDSRENR